MGLASCFIIYFVIEYALELLIKPFIHDDYLGRGGVFYVLSGISALGAIYVFAFIRETKGLTEKQKKLLYTPVRFVQAYRIFDEIEN